MAYFRKHLRFCCFIPPYSLEYAPIELFFARVKKNLVESIRGTTVKLKSSKGLQRIEHACSLVERREIVSLWQNFILKVRQDVCEVAEF
mmetsp:Transcript_2293/g.2996  ORF Transcript_2293/g.2996 Transcript_2293/m.2996 type:complete len:89 (+) Transcript_2293:188-454(+)